MTSQAKDMLTKYTEAKSGLSLALADAAKLEGQARDTGVELVKSEDTVRVLHDELAGLQELRRSQEAMLDNIKQVWEMCWHTLANGNTLKPGPRLIMMIRWSQYCRFFYNVNSYTGKTASLYWDSPEDKMTFLKTYSYAFCGENVILFLHLIAISLKFVLWVQSTVSQHWFTYYSTKPLHEPMLTKIHDTSLGHNELTPRGLEPLPATLVILNLF